MKLEPKKPDALAGYSLCTAALFLVWETQMYFFLRTTLLRIVGLIDEISTKRNNIEEKIRGHFLSIGLRNCCFDHIRNDKCPNDSRRIMTFVASVPFWFLAGKKYAWRILR